MIRLQIIERAGADLQRRLLDAMRTGELRTFDARKRGRQVHHVASPGWMNWSSSHGIIDCEVISPRKPGSEWQLFSKFLGRLADRYADSIQAINVQFPGGAAGKPAPARRKRRGTKR